MSQRKISWSAALRDLHADRLTQLTVREVGRTPGMGIHHTLSAWAGCSGRRYAVAVRRIDAVQPAEMVDCVVLLVGRDAQGRAFVIGGGRDLTLIDAEAMLDGALSAGAIEVHLHSLTDGAAARFAVLADLEAPGFTADLREVA